MRFHTAGRRTALAVAAVAVFSLALAGCSSDSGGSSDGKTIELKYWSFFTGSDEPTVKKIIQEFNASQKGVKVDFIATPGDVLKQKLVQSVTAGDAPDIVSIDTPDLSQFVEAGALQPIDDFWKSGLLDESKLLPASAKASEYKGHRYGAPISTFASLLLYNKGILKKAGYDAPPTTWDEFKAMAPKLTVDTNKDGTPDQWAMALSVKQGVPGFQTFAINNGGGLVSSDGTKAIIDDPKTIEAVKYWTDLVKNEKIAPIGLNGGDADSLFSSGKAAMEIIGPWLPATAAKAGVDVGIADPLKGPDGSNIAVGGVTNYSIPTGISDEHKKAAYKFMAYWNSRKAQVEYASSTGFPTNRTDVPSSELAGNPYSQKFADSPAMKNLLVYMAAVNQGSQINSTVWEPALEKIENGADVTSTLTAANAAAQKLLDTK